MTPKPVPSRTINPLHFEDLDPHRFEDLIRQLVYDWRDWQRLEALGRSGNDDGVDIRGLTAEPDTNDATEPDETTRHRDARTWFVQVKREKRIGPARAKTIAAEALTAVAQPPYGFLLAAACDFSKRSRDALRKELAEAGVAEVHLWGKAELEDLLFLPANDHLLFAYFGISLRTRRRSKAAELRARLATKRQLFRALGDLNGIGNDPVLVRDPFEPAYPVADTVPDFETNPAWQVVLWPGHHFGRPDHVCLLIDRRHAWLSDDRRSWDTAGTCSHVLPGPGHEGDQADREACDRLWRYFYNGVPERNRAWFDTYALVHYDEILLVDELGDAFFDPPHLLIERGPEGFFTDIRQFLVQDRQRDELRDVAQLARATLFPHEIPEVEWESRW